MAWPAVGVVVGGEASVASQPATGDRSTRHDRRCFGRLEHEDQRLKKHYGRWMDIVWSLELESFILTKLRKPSVPVNLVAHKSASHQGESQLAGGVFIFLCVIRRHFRWVRADSGGNVFFMKYRDPSGGSQLSGGGIIILRIIRRHFPVWAPTVSLFRWLLFVDHVDLAAPRAQTRWTRARPRKRTTRSR